MAEQKPETQKPEGKPEAEIKPVHRNLEWRCLTCKTVAPPTGQDYARFINHKCSGKRTIWLVDKDTGEQLANNIKQAISLGFIAGKEEPPEGEREKKEITEPEVSPEGIFRYTILLPADAFTLFNLAKTCGLEKDGEKPFDEWVWDCITARFATDYKRQLILAPIEEA